MADPRHELGREGERLAERYLRRQGLRLIARNVRTPTGELDLVMRERETVVFVEVKSLTDDRAAPPEAQLRGPQRKRLLAGAQWLLNRKRWTDRPCRFDVVAVILPPHGEPRITHHQDVLRPTR